MGFPLLYLLAALASQQLPALPPILPPLLLGSSLALTLLLGFTPQRLWRWVGALLLGVATVLGHATHQLAERLPESLAEIDLVVEGVIDSIVEVKGNGLSWEMEAVAAFPPPAGEPELPPPIWQGRLRLSSYPDRHGSPLPPLQGGEQWRLTVRLKPPHGLINPVGFDAEGWLFGAGIDATGSLRPKAAVQPLRLAAASPLSIHRWRQQLYDRFRSEWSNSPYQGLMIALVLGESGLITPEQWQTFTNSGTNHLIAISGLHITLIATLAYGLTFGLWSRYPLGRRWIAPRRLALVGALLAAALYTALAGFALPTQRALVMLLWVTVALIAQRPLVVRYWLLWSGVVLVALNPFALLSAGFWLSFGAVGLILLALKPQRRWSDGPWWGVAIPIRWQQNLLLPVVVQGWLSLGLAPLLLLYFYQIPLLSPLANLIVVPWVSFLVIPPLLLAVLWAIVTDWPLPNLLRLWSEGHLEWVEALLATFNRWLPPYPLAIEWGWPLGVALLGLIWLALPRGWPLRSLGVLALLPLLAQIPDRPTVGQFWVTVLDVGQGLAVAVETAHHRLLYDSGPAFPSGLNMGAAVVLPFARSRSWNTVDRLVLSHGDLDHAGGAAALLQHLSILQLEGADHLPPLGRTVHLCQAGVSWQWDGVEFRYLHPGRDEGKLSENDRSCVLQVRTEGEGLLLSGDIEVAAEKRLQQRYGSELRSTLLVAPHHGSKTSSSGDFIRQVEPRWVVIPAGYRNRYRHPHPSVVARYQQVGSRIFSSADDGAVTLCLGRGCLGSEPQSLRQIRPRYWYAPSH